MKIAVAQLNYIVGDFKGNISKIIQCIERAKDESVDIIVFSELCVTGYYPYDLLNKPEFVLSAWQYVHKISNACHNIAAVVGIPRMVEGGYGSALYNSAVLIADGKIKSVHNKISLSKGDVFDEHRHFEADNRVHTAEYRGVRFGIMLGMDLISNSHVISGQELQNYGIVTPVEILMKQNPEFVINISASPFSGSSTNHCKDELVSRAKQYQIPVIYANQVGGNGELIFEGNSIFIDEDGESVYEMKSFEEDFKIVDLENIEKIGSISDEPIEKICKALTLGIRDYFIKSRFHKAVIGLSGGIDSAVTAVLAVRALGVDNVHGLLLPSRFSSDHSIDDARELAENLSIQYDIVSIETAMDTIKEILFQILGNIDNNLTEENIQARLRGLYLMAYSNKFGHILLNTSNKSEYAVGYGTLYGDMNGGLAVLGDLYKSDVYSLARYINRNGEVIPENSITKPPSAELKENQKDTDTLPDYDILDKILFNYLEKNLPINEIVALGIDRDIIESVVGMVDSTEYKRFQAAPILRISQKSFGSGRRMPLVMR